MPMVSEAQRGYLWATHPEVAQEFEAHTPRNKRLPRHKRQVAKAMPMPMKPMAMAKPPVRPPMKATPMKPAMNRPMSSPVKPMTPNRPMTPAVPQQRPPGIKLNPTGMQGRPIVKMLPERVSKAAWEIGPATVSDEDKKYTYGGAAGVGVGGGAYAARKQDAKFLPWTPTRRAAADRLMSLPTEKTVQMDLATLRQFRRNPGVRINDYRHTVDLARAMDKGTKLPPVTVRIVNGKQPFIMDGMHRINAAHMIGLDSVPIRIQEETRAPRFRFPNMYNRKSLKMQQRVPRQLSPQELRDFGQVKPKTPFGRFALKRNALKGGKPWNNAVARVAFR